MNEPVDDHGVAWVRELLAAHLPGHRAAAVTLLGEGMDNRAYLVDGELVVRLTKESDPPEVHREARLLRVLAEHVPLPVPEPVLVLPEHGCLAYPALPGVPLLEFPRDRWSARAEPIAQTLAGLLAALHSIGADRLAGLVRPDDDPPAEYLAEAARHHTALAGLIPAEHRRPVREFLSTPPPAAGGTLVFAHNDLGIEHVLVDPREWTVTGIIDWTDAAMVDPAQDLGRLHRDLGPATVDILLRGHPAADPSLRERALFYARCGLLEDWAYGLETGRLAYATKAVAALEWLFPPDAD